MGRAKSIGNVYAELSVKDRMTAGMKRAGKSVDAFASKVASIGAGMAAALPAAAFAGVAASMKSAIDAGGQLSDMMARTGAEGEGLFVMQRAFENAGIAADSVPDALNRMQKALATGNEGFAKLGMNIADLKGMDATAAFRSTAEAIAKIPDPADRAAMAMEIFGKSGGKLLAVMNDTTAFSSAAEQVGSLGKTLSDNAGKFDKISDSMELFKVKAQQVGAEVAVALLPQLEAMADGMNKIDFGQETKDAIGYAAALGKIVSKASELSPFMNIMRLAGVGVGTVMGSNAERQGQDIKIPDMPWIGGNPFEKYNEGVMIKDLKNYTETIPELLKRPAWTEYKAGPTPGELGIPGLASMIEAVMSSTAPPAERERQQPDANWQATQYDVNDMQRRGLGMGGEITASQANKQTEKIASAVERIAKKLERADLEGGLVWR